MKTFQPIHLTFLLLLLATIAYTHLTLAYVRSEILVNEFAGMQEVREVYRKKQQEGQANVDTLKADYRRKESAGVPKEAEVFPGLGMKFINTIRRNINTKLD